MNKTLILAAGSIIFIFAGSLCIFAQRQNVPPADFNNPEFSALAQKVDALAASVQRSNAEISGKLDQVLNNQDRILKELDVVRIRASRH
jgi:hypothetical protein